MLHTITKVRSNYEISLQPQMFARAVRQGPSCQARPDFNRFWSSDTVLHNNSICMLVLDHNTYVESEIGSETLIFMWLLLGMVIQMTQQVYESFENFENVFEIVRGRFESFVLSLRGINAWDLIASSRSCFLNTSRGPETI